MISLSSTWRCRRSINFLRGYSLLLATLLAAFLGNGLLGGLLHLLGGGLLHDLLGDLLATFGLGSSSFLCYTREKKRLV